MTARELWPGPEVRWFVLGPDAKSRRLPAVVAVDDLLLGVAWAW